MAREVSLAVLHEEVVFLPAEALEVHSRGAYLGLDHSVWEAAEVTATMEASAVLKATAAVQAMMVRQQVHLLTHAVSEAAPEAHTV